MTKKILSKTTKNSIIDFILPFLIALIIWQLIAEFILTTQLPTPLELANKFIILAFEKNVLLNNITNSLQRFITGYLLATIIGISLGMLMGINKTISSLFKPMLSLLIAVPTIAWVPVLLITLGLGDQTVITAIFLGGFFSITYSTMHGIQTVDKSLIRASQTMGQNHLGRFIHVLLPGSLVSLLPGLRLAIGYSWRALVGAEMLAAMIKTGLGKMIYDARFWNDIQAMFLGLILIGLIGLALDRLIMTPLEIKTLKTWGMIQHD